MNGDERPWLRFAPAWHIQRQATVTWQRQATHNRQYALLQFGIYIFKMTSNLIKIRSSEYYNVHNDRQNTTDYTVSSVKKNFKKDKICAVEIFYLTIMAPLEAKHKYNKTRMICLKYMSEDRSRQTWWIILIISLPSETMT